MPSPIISGRARISTKQAESLLRFYAERRSPKAASKASGLSPNTVYLLYDRIRWRLVLTRYYQDAAISPDEDGLAPEVKRELRLRRGIGEDNIFPHAAELIEWAEEWPPKIVLKHLRKIIELTGPLDIEPELDELEQEKLGAYIRYARTELVYRRVEGSPITDEFQQSFRDRAKTALDTAWRAYRAASKRLERELQAKRPKSRR